MKRIDLNGREALIDKVGRHSPGSERMVADPEVSLFLSYFPLERSCRVSTAEALCR
jgi:hypothetical protein